MRPLPRPHQGNGATGSAPGQGFLPQESFLRILHLEHRRSERSGRRFVLMLVDAANLIASEREAQAVAKILDVLARSTRETDVTGWYHEGSVVGIIFTEIGQTEGRTVASALLAKVSAALSGTLAIEQINQVHISFYVFPEEWDENGNDGASEVHPDTAPHRGSREISSILKRGLDILGSLAAIVLFSPFLIGAALAVKLTSAGPVLFRQRRVGQYGKTFTFLKFRSMHTANNPAAHEAFVKSLIRAKHGAGSRNGTDQVFKLTNDPRITPVGRFIRRTSIDELPQFFNVLAGDMSLVGPRPPIPYEVRHYDTWHQRRFLAVKPGITGLWQVTARSKVGFDDMVRLDLQYARTWSLWLDLKILLQTPRAVLFGDGAY
ncbi:MAG: sugar transferase [Bryobacterales bacterium]|nr:sugar transferase [Bryobacterales bacterium]